MKQKILWIEDWAFEDVPEWSGPVNVSGKYEVVVAMDASEAIRQLMDTEFDAVIVDIRIPPGDDAEWVRLFHSSGDSKIKARLGLHLLYSLLRHPKAKIRLEGAPSWITPEVFGLLTVESKMELEGHLEVLQIKVFRQKTAEVSPNTLLEVIEETLLQRKDRTLNQG